MTVFRALLLAGAAIALCGCQTNRTVTAPLTPQQEKAVADLNAGKPQELSYLYRSVVVEGKREAVLNWMRIGSETMRMGRFDLAAEAFDNALSGIEAVYADNPAAEKARSVWNAESVKDFKGEPHERAMAYYYRGLLYLMAGDPDNARASFKGALLQDSFAEKERYRADFAAASFLEGWTNRCTGNGSQAQENFKEAETARSTLSPPDPADRTLVLIEAGNGPMKVALGQHREQLAYREQEGPQGGYRVRLGTQEAPAHLAENLFFQATTRGGREMDALLADKASTKTATATAGAVGVGAGLGMVSASQYQYGNQSQNMAAAGAAVMLIGLIAHAAAQSMTAEADTRYWWLPHSIFLATLPAAGRGAAPGGIELLHEGGASALHKRDMVRSASFRDCTVVWVPAPAVTTSPSKEALAALEESLATKPPAKKDKDTAGKTKAKPVRTEAKNTPAPTPASTPAADTGSGNCRSPTGARVNLEPGSCKAINGTVLSPTPVKS